MGINPPGISSRWDNDFGKGGMDAFRIFVYINKKTPCGVFLILFQNFLS